jgi:hypothetical protein
MRHNGPRTAVIRCAVHEDLDYGVQDSVHVEPMDRRIHRLTFLAGAFAAILIRLFETRDFWVGL